MAKDSSATTRQQTPHVKQTTQTPNVSETTHHAARAKIEALAEIICAGGAESAAALFVLMGTLETSTHPEVLAHTAKYFAFTRCGELNVYGMIDAQVGMIEGKLLGHV